VTLVLDEGVLDDVAALEAVDAGGMLRAVASGGAQVREAVRFAEEAGVGRLAEDGQPRAILVAGVGGSGIAGDVLRAVCGITCRVPVVTERGFTLPGWIGPLDLVVAVSCSGTTEETLALAEEAARRGCRLVTVGAVRSPLAAIAEQAQALHVPVAAAGRPPRANLWSLSVPLVVLADVLGLAATPAGILAAVADRLDAVAERCAPHVETTHNPAKSLALELSGGLPMVWGSGEVGEVAAYRLACQLPRTRSCPRCGAPCPRPGTTSW
jgi:glucose/mannose-6-phosphate isomerase